jgi:hypothetical protein
MDCPVCSSVTGLKNKTDIVLHMGIHHKDNVGLLIDKFADYIVAKEGSA